MDSRAVEHTHRAPWLPDRLSLLVASIVGFYCRNHRPMDICVRKYRSLILKGNIGQASGAVWFNTTVTTAKGSVCETMLRLSTTCRKSIWAPHRYPHCYCKTTEKVRRGETVSWANGVVQEHYEVIIIVSKVFASDKLRCRSNINNTGLERKSPRHEFW